MYRRPLGQSKRMVKGELTSGNYQAKLEGRGRGTGGRRRPYDEGVHAWLNAGKDRPRTVEDVGYALKYLCTLVTSVSTTGDTALREALASTLRFALTMLATLGIEDPYDVGISLGLLNLSQGGTNGQNSLGQQKPELWV